MSPAHLPMGDKIKHMQPMSVIRLKKRKKQKGKKNFDHRLQASVNQLTMKRGA